MIGKNPFQSENNVVGIEAEAQSLLRELAAPPVPGEGVGAAIRRASRRTGLTFSRAHKLWYGNAKAILADEMDRLRANAAAMREARNHEFAREHADVGRRLAALETELATLLRGMARAKTEAAGVRSGDEVRAFTRRGPGMLEPRGENRAMADRRR